MQSSRKYGDPEVGRRLRAARRLAGFNSAQAAAEAHAWPPSLYAAHEGARRMPRADDLRAYASAFSVSFEWLAFAEVVREQDAAASAELEKNSSGDLARARRGSAARLKLARRLAGFRSPTSAYCSYGWNKASYLSNENGHGGLSMQSALRYAAAFGVNPGWLLSGDPPSGLGSEVDALGPEPVWSEALAGLVDPDRRGPLPSEAALARPARPATGLNWSGLLQPMSDGPAADSVIKMLVATGTSVVDPACFVVVTPVPGNRATPGDIVVVDRPGPPSALYVVHERGGLRLVAEPDAHSGGGAGMLDLVGRVIARIQRD